MQVKKKKKLPFSTKTMSNVYFIWRHCNMSWFIHREMGWAMRKKKICPFLKLSDMAENVELQLALWHSDCTVSVIPHQETDRLTEASCLRERPVVPISLLCKRPALKINSKKSV